MKDKITSIGLNLSILLPTTPKLLLFKLEEGSLELAQASSEIHISPTSVTHRKFDLYVKIIFSFQ